MSSFILTFFIFTTICVFFSNGLPSPISLLDKIASAPSSVLTHTAPIPNIASRLGESVLLPCGSNEHELLKQLESTVPSMPVLVNWFKHYSLTRRSDKPIYAKYLANNIDYEPHISRDYENRLQVVDKINLNISNLKAIDEALYECRLILFDKAYADSQTGSMFYLQVYVAPEFEYPNEEVVYFKPNVPIRLYCYAKGKPTPSITWFKNGKKIEANTSVLQESPSFLDDSVDIFEYRCKAENIIGQIEHTVKVIRSGSLFFTEPLKNLTVTEGTILNWPCLAQSNAEITYKWFKDSVSVQLNLHKWSDRGALFQDGMLYLLEVFRNDSGLFECHAFTDNKRIETSAYLNVQYGPEIEEFPSPFFVYDGSHSIVMDCVVKSNPQQYVLEWFKDKYLLSNTNKYQILPNNSLLIRNVQKSDKGNYYCTCNNTIKKTVSSLIKLEIVEPKKVELSSMYASSSSSFRLPCKALDTHNLFKKKIDSNEIKWYRLNSKLPSNRYSIDSNGSLLLQNLRSIDSGMYLCKISDHLIHQLTNKMIGFTNNIDKIIKLNVIQNITLPEYVSAEIISQEEKDNQLKAELPLPPINIKINQTKQGVLVTWVYPFQTPVKIENFQIYYRQILEKKNDWKTTESIQSSQDNYLIENSFLVQNHLYELQIVSYSLYSKSVPSLTIKFKFSSNDKISVMQFISTYSLPTTPSVVSTPFTLFNMLNMSQLDVILITIFFILLFILAVCIVACIAYRKSVKRGRKKRNQKLNSKDMVDDWGFQSSAATATFLSSTSSSEKSFTLYKQNKTLNRNSAIDCDLKSKLECQKESKKFNTTSDESTNNYFNDKCEDYDDNDYYYSAKKTKTINSGQTAQQQQRNSIVIIKAGLNTITSSTGISSKCNVLNDDNTIKSDTVCMSTNSNIGSSSTNTNSSCTNSSSSNSSNSSSNNSTSSSGSKNSSSDNCNLIDNSGTSSGITSGNSCISDESDESSILNKNDNSFAINTIKYNAKTNILHQSSFPTKTLKKNEPILAETLLKSGNTKNFMKYGNNNTKNTFNNSSKLMLGTLLECQTTSIDANRNFTSQSSQNSSQASTTTKEENEYSDEYCFNPNLNEEFSGISLDVDGSTANKEKNYRNNQNKTNKILILNSYNDNTNSYVNNLDFYPWINENNNSSSASITPVESSAYSTTSISPPLILKALPLSQSITQATASSSSSAALSSQIQSSSNINKKMNYENLLSNYQYANPFPLSNQYHHSDSTSEAQKQMFQLNSSSSLTLVSKAPSMSYCYINNENNSSSNDIFAKASTEAYNLETARTSVLTGTISSAASSSSSSSGCSSLENNNQYFSKITNEKPVHFPTNRFVDPNERNPNSINENLLENDKNRTQNSSFIMPQRNSTDTLNRPFPNGPNVKKYQQFSTYKPLLKSSINSDNYGQQQIKYNNTNPINKYTPYNATKGDFV